MRRLTFTAQALEDFEQIHDFIAQDNLAAASRFISRLKDRCNELLPFPGSGRKRDEIKSGYRSVTEGEYVVLYKVVEDELVIVRIIHGKRDLGKAISD